MKNKIIILVFGIILFSASVNANLLVMEKDSFSPGETATAKVTVENMDAFPVDWTVECSFSSNSPDYPPTPFLDHLHLSPGESKVLSYSLAIENTTPSGTFTVRAVVKDQGMRLVWTNSSSFSVGGTLKTMSFSLLVCKNEGCGQSEAVFFSKETAVIKYNSPIQGLSVNAKITKPDNSVVEVALPNAIVLSEVGAYRIHATATKGGYANAEGDIDFAAISKPANISQTNFSSSTTSSSTTIVLISTTSSSSTSSSIPSTLISSTTSLSAVTSQPASTQSSTSTSSSIIESSSTSSSSTTLTPIPTAGGTGAQTIFFLGITVIVIILLSVLYVKKIRR